MSLVVRADESTRKHKLRVWNKETRIDHDKDKTVSCDGDLEVSFG